MIWSEPRAFVELEPPRRVRAALHAGSIAMLALATGEQLDRARLSPTLIVRAIEDAAFFDPDERLWARRVWEEARKGSFGWTIEVAPFFVGLDPAWTKVVQFVWCLWNDYLEEETLTVGTSGTRLDTLLEMTRAGATAAEIGRHGAELAEGLAAGKVSAFQEATVSVARSQVTGAVVDYFTGGVGSRALEGVASWYQSDATKVDHWVKDLALRYLLADHLKDTDPGRFAYARQRFFNEAQQLGSSSDHSRRVRMLLAAYGNMADKGESVVRAMPNLVDMRVNDAVSVLRALNVEPQLVDHSGQGRMMVQQSRWLVVAQHPDPGAPTSYVVVRLAFAKPGERVRTLQTKAMLAGH
ncbi:PASTA domain-containing protein [Auraticoccus monumenti]|uniref:PASTA domain-containing protein n=1 Tax=Auraticoccus monumenti TaxID=675864 RepID=A0A1G6T7X4_9ACTN|nr:PASTA domain-containing protein [Auraticoccus monumenti]SDD25200.1 hypothetical protein SAMN04489747_0552 [Auraticoccus monumenti]